MSQSSSPAANSRIETLPDDLKKIANKLISKKFGLPEEPDEVVQREQNASDPRASSWSDPYTITDTRTLTYHLRVVGQLFRDGGYAFGPSGYGPTGHVPNLSNLPRTISFPMYEGTDPLVIADKVNATLRSLEQQFGVQLEAIRA